MTWRTIYIANRCNLYLKDRNLCYKNNENSNVLKVPLEDIGVIVLENNYSTITTALLSKFGDYNIALFTCDDFHVPNAVMYPFNKHSRHTLIANMQINMSEPLKKRIWKKIIQKKISNQVYILQKYNRKEAKLVENLIEKVKSGDSTNVEGYSASIYWKSLFVNFTRNDNNFINACLNYGYSIIRGCICRSLSASGLLPALGVFHSNQLNQFNLADDIIEFYRPIIDLLVIEIIQSNEDKKELSHNEKVRLLESLNYIVSINNIKTNVLNSIELVVDSFVRCLKNNDASLFEIIDFVK